MINDENYMDCRYGDLLEEALNELGTEKILFLDFEYGYQGHVGIDVLLKDGRVFSYKYFYGLCPGCDDWEDRGLSDNEIKQEMLQEATFFNDINQYQEANIRSQS